MHTHYPRGLELPLILLTALDGAARELLKQTARKPPANRPRKGATRRPGSRTPMWLALVEAVRPHLRIRGEKANLARLLEIPPPRLSEFLTSRKAAPDAERTLRLLYWLSQRQRGLQPG